MFVMVWLWQQSVVCITGRMPQGSKYDGASGLGSSSSKGTQGLLPQTRHVYVLDELDVIWFARTCIVISNRAHLQLLVARYKEASTAPYKAQTCKVDDSQRF